jgi:putative transposase
MTRNKQLKHRRHSIRLKGYDYSTSGAYFITICVQDGKYLLSAVVDDKLALKDAGRMVQEVWGLLTRKFQAVQLDSFVIMPNHMHFIVLLTNPDDEVDLHVLPTQTQEGQTRRSAPTSLPEVVQWFKSFTTARYRVGVRDNNWPPFPGRLWQRNYWERIIRNERELEAIRRYIWNNPANWKKDKLYRGNPSSC